MKLVVVRHAEVDLAEQKNCSSEEFDRFAAAYDHAPIVSVEREAADTSAYALYTSTLSRARDTASQLFGREDTIATPLLNEVPVRSFRDTARKRPLFFWKAMSRVQWLLGMRRQPETRWETVKRAQALADLLEERDADCILVTHAFYSYTLLRVFRKRGYVVRRSGMLHIRNLERILLTKRALHCGGCGFNCLLSRPGCGIGMEKARRMG